MRFLQVAQFAGRFGNQVGQWAFARSLAARLGSTFECPDWVGREVFTGPAEIPLPTVRLPKTPCEYIPGHQNVAIHGYFQFQEAFNLMRRSELKQWLTVQERWLNAMPRTNLFYVAAHLRRGDYVKHSDQYCIIERAAYEKAIVAAGYNLADVVWVDEEHATVVKSVPKHLSFLPDFLTLMRADVIFRANSTFSFWAGALSNAVVYSPRVGEKIGRHEDIEFELGNHCAMLGLSHHPNTQHSDMHLPEE